MFGGEFGRGAQGLGRVADAVVLLVVALQTFENLDGLFEARLADLDLLEAAGQRAVALEGGLVLGVGGRADAANLAGGEHRLDDVRGVHRAAGDGARADDGVNLVDEEDDVLLLPQGADDRLEALLELAAVLRAREQRAHVERVDLGTLQRLGHRALVNLEREPLGNRGLADAGVADVDGVVLAPPAEDLNRARNLGLAADERVDLAFGGARDEVSGEGGERVARPGRVLLLVGAALGDEAPAAGLDLRDAVREVVEHVEARHALLLEEVDGVRVGRLEEGGEDVAAVHLALPRPFGLEQRVLDDALEGGRVLGQRVARGGHGFELLVEERLQLAHERLGAPAAVAQDVGRRLVVEQRVEEVFERHVLVPPLDRLHRREVERFL
jgi:hypothetical protein